MPSTSVARSKKLSARVAAPTLRIESTTGIFRYPDDILQKKRLAPLP
jgi:hypothetical protein